MSQNRINHAGENGEDGTIIARDNDYFTVKLDGSNEKILVPRDEYEILADGEWHAKG